jgi:hypothetical protein
MIKSEQPVDELIKNEFSYGDKLEKEYEYLPAERLTSIDDLYEKFSIG